MRPMWGLAAIACAALTVFSACGGGGGKKDNGGQPARTALATAVATRSATARATSAATEPSDGGGGEAALPEDACALVSLADVQSIAPEATTEGVATSEGGPVPSVGCIWEWTDPANVVGGTGSLKITVSQLPPGVNEQTVRQSLTVEVADAGENGRELSGIGDYAILTSVIGGSAEIQAVVHGLLLDIEVLGFAGGTNARAKQDLLIPIAEKVARGL